MLCLFCNLSNQFNTIEHIIPESLGNNDLILRKEVCDSCQKHFSHVENYVLSKTPIGFWRTILGIKSKHHKLPKIDFAKPTKNKGRFPDSHAANDNISFESQEDFSTAIFIPDDKTISDYKGRFKYVLTPRVLNELGRFLGKIGVELICLHDAQMARSGLFDEIRKYARYGSLKEIWPIFHFSRGSIEDLISYDASGNEVKEKVNCYSYSINQISSYTILRLTVGTDNWCICLNDMFPTPEIRNLFLPHNLNLIWYFERRMASRTR
ncbi:HNH endonuclease [Hymenobacter terrenus]|uniref:HNH endonuclease n=1 Tax=Hymenobacter terrenus TaxID=1629124 RepID=UPI0006199061|nr:HNH endonuclease [Hymenobacter terrenus]